MPADARRYSDTMEKRCWHTEGTEKSHISFIDIVFTFIDMIDLFSFVYE